MSFRGTQWVWRRGDGLEVCLGVMLVGTGLETVEGDEGLSRCDDS